MNCCGLQTPNIEPLWWHVHWAPVRVRPFKFIFKKKKINCLDSLPIKNLLQLTKNSNFRYIKTYNTVHLHSNCFIFPHWEIDAQEQIYCFKEVWQWCILTLELSSHKKSPLSFFFLEKRVLFMHKMFFLAYGQQNWYAFYPIKVTVTIGNILLSPGP